MNENIPKPSCGPYFATWVTTTVAVLMILSFVAGDFRWLSAAGSLAMTIRIIFVIVSVIIACVLNSLHDDRLKDWRRTQPMSETKKP